MKINEAKLKVAKLMKKTIILVILLVMVLATGVHAAEYVIRHGHVNPPGEPNYEALENVFKPRLEELSDGRIKVEIYPLGQLGQEREMIEMVQMGTLDMTTPAAAPLSLFCKAMNMFSFPYLFEDFEHLIKVVDGEIGQELGEQVLEEAGVRILGWHLAGIRNVFNNKKPIWEPADMKGMKIRVMEDEIFIRVFQELGALPTPMPYGEVYSSLATGVIDAADNPPTGYRNMAFFEVAPYYSLTAHSVMPKPVLINPAVWDSLPEDLQDIMMKVIRETEEYNRKLSKELIEEDIAWVVSHGARVNYVDPGPFAEKVVPVWDEFADIVGAHYIEQILELKK